MKILDLQERYLEVLDDVQDKSLIDGISGGGFAGVVVAASTGAFLVADLTGTINILSSINSSGSFTGNPKDFNLTFGTIINVNTTPGPK